MVYSICYPSHLSDYAHYRSSAFARTVHLDFDLGPSNHEYVKQILNQIFFLQNIYISFSSQKLVNKIHYINSY